MIGSVNLPGLKSWTLELGEGAAPTKWTGIGNGTTNVTDHQVGTIDGAGLASGVYTLRLSTDTGLVATVTFNVTKTAPSPSPTPTRPTGPAPTRTPTPGGPAPQTPIPNR